MSKNEKIIKVGQFLSTKDHNREKVQGKIMSISKLKESLWVSIKTQEGMRTINLTKA